jgi:hypothetical protein
MAAKLGFVTGLVLASFAAPIATAQTVPCAPSWQPTFGHGPGLAIALVGHDDGGGPALYAGYYTTPFGYLGRWNGTAWSWLGNFTPGSGWFDGTSWHYGTWVGSLAEFDAGSGPTLYAAGNFHLFAGATSARFIAEWDGIRWSDLQGGMSGGYPQYYGWSGVYYETQVNALTVFDDGTGRALYVGGDFTHAGTVAANFVARWNGSAWSALGIGLNAPVIALTEYDDGSGPALYAGGWFTGAGGVSAQGIAKWNGTSWSALGSAAGGLSNGSVDCLSAFDDGSGPALFAGGWFSVAGGPAAYHVAKWDGTSWSVIGTWTGLNDGVYMLNTLDDGTGPALYAGGWFTPAGGGLPTYLMRWNGSAWSALGSGVSGLVEATTVCDIGRGPALYAGGSFTCPESGDTFLARWAPPSGCLAVCEPGSGGVSPCPCANPPGGPGRGCDNSAATGGAALAASGIAGLAHDTLVFRTLGETPSALSIVLQADALDASGSVFGQGVRCVSGTLIRLYVKTAHSGSISAPRASDASVSARSAQLGDPIAPGSQRHYGVYYRDPQVLGGCPAASTFDITQQLSVLWQP